MKVYAEKVIDLIEQLGVNDFAMKRAHARGGHYKGTVELNRKGEALFGQRSEVLIRLSDAPPNKRHPSWMIPLKGLSLYMDGNQPVNLIFVTFPYFPWTQSQSIVSIATYANAIKRAKDKYVIINLMNKIMKTEHFYRQFGTFIRNQPISLIRKFRTYYNPHYYYFNGQYIKFHVQYLNKVIYLYAAYFDTAAPINVLRKSKDEHCIGKINLIQQVNESRDYFELYDVGPHLQPPLDDEIMKLRHEMYLISNDRRQKEENRQNKDSEKSL